MSRKGIPAWNREYGKWRRIRLGLIKDGLWGILYPRRCFVCDGVLPVGERELCRGCEKRIAVITEPLCKKCGKPLEQDEEYCFDCRGRKSSYDFGYALYVYNKYMQESVRRFKFGGRTEYADSYAKRMYGKYGEWLKDMDADMLLPVPVHWKRLRERGYNQAELLARRLSEYTGVPTVSEYLCRLKNTIPQKELSNQERKKNVAGAFVVTKKIRELKKTPQCAIIIDDIYTTGSTIEECSRVLRAEGISKIYFLCVCVGKGY